MNLRASKKKIAIAVFAGLALVSTVGYANDDWKAGVSAYQSGNFSSAATHFQKVVEAQPDWAGGHLMLGQALYQLGRYQDALSHIREAYDKQPDDLQTQIALSRAYLALNRFEDAAALLSNIDERSLPQNYRSVYQQMLAKALQESGQTDQALEALRKAAAANPNDAAAWFNYGSAAFNHGDTDAAIQALQKAAQLAGDDPKIQEAYAKTLIRKGRETAGQQSKVQLYKRAADAAARLVSLSSSYDNLLLLGETQLGAKEYSESVETFTQASSKNPGSWLPQFYLGQAYTKMDQYRQAESALQTSLERARTDKEKMQVWSQLGYVNEKQRDYEAAKVAYTNAKDPASVARVQENQEIEQYNREVEEEAEQIKALEEEQKRLEEALEELPGGPPPRR